MRAWGVVLAVAALACGGGREAESQDVEAAQEQAERAVAAILAGDRETQAPAVCDVLRSGVVEDVFGVDPAAVASLESAVATLEEGITVTVQGKEHTTQIDFDDWMDGVGDKAAWAPRTRELVVAADGVRFAVAVSGAGDEAACEEKAIEVARRVIDTL